MPYRSSGTPPEPGSPARWKERPGIIAQEPYWRGTGRGSLIDLEGNCVRLPAPGGLNRDFGYCVAFDTGCNRPRAAVPPVRVWWGPCGWDIVRGTRHPRTAPPPMT